MADERAFYFLLGLVVALAVAGIAYLAHEWWVREEARKYMEEMVKKGRIV